MQLADVDRHTAAPGVTGGRRDGGRRGRGCQRAVARHSSSRTSCDGPAHEDAGSADGPQDHGSQATPAPGSKYQRRGQEYFRPVKVGKVGGSGARNRWVASAAMRMTSLFLRTLRDDPADAEVDSHRLLVRAGYIRRVSAGHLRLAAARLPGAAQDRTDRAGGDGPGRRPGGAASRSPSRSSCGSAAAATRRTADLMFRLRDRKETASACRRRPRRSSRPSSRRSTARTATCP